MPTYEYECEQCERRHEVFQSITAKPLTKCPKCGGRLRRLISSSSGFLFKGGGFYITDYRSKGYREAKKKDEGDREAKKKDEGSSTGKPSSGSSK